MLFSINLVESESKQIFKRILPSSNSSGDNVASFCARGRSLRRSSGNFGTSVIAMMPRADGFEPNDFSMRLFMSALLGVAATRSFQLMHTTSVFTGHSVASVMMM